MRLPKKLLRIRAFLDHELRPLVLAGVLTGICGLLLLLNTHAITPTTSIEAEDGTVSGGASVIQDSAASGGQAIRFGAGAQTLHYAANIGTQQSLANSLGFNLYDIAGSTSNPSDVATSVNSLPTGAKAIIWVGNLDNTNCTPGFTYAQFTAQVDALKSNSRVFAYYISDEPHPAICPTAAADIMARADYIRANAPSQKSFIVVLDGSNQCGTNLGCEYAALAPSNTHVDYIGVDPYPCHYAADGVTPVACDNSLITSRVDSAIAHGIPASDIIPTFQTFGQANRTDGKTPYYRMPSASELTSMLATWQGLIPKPAFDYAYSFDTQCTVTSCVASQAITTDTSIQAVVQTHNNQ